MKYKIITLFCLLVFSVQNINADVIITYKNGKVIVFKGSISCKNVVKMPEGTTCKDGVVVLSNNGS